MPLVPSLCFLPDSHDFVAAGPRSTIWPGDSTGARKYFGSHQIGMITCFAVPPKGTILASASDLSVCIWSTETFQTCLSTISSPGVDLTPNVALYPDGRLIAIGSRRAGVQLRDISNLHNDRFRESKSSYRRALFSPTGLLILTDPIHPTEKDTVCILSQEDARGHFTVPKWSQVLKSSSLRVSSTPDGRWLGFGRDGRLEFRNSATGALAFAVFGPKDPNREEICMGNWSDQI